MMYVRDSPEPIAHSPQLAKSNERMMTYQTALAASALAKAHTVSEH